MKMDLSNRFCVNSACADYGEAGLGNIGTRGVYGRDRRPMSMALVKMFPNRRFRRAKAGVSECAMDWGLFPLLLRVVLP